MLQRQSRGRSSSAPRSAPAQTRGAHTATAPAGYAQPHAPASPAAASRAPAQQPGLLGQMAATAGSIAVGSTIGHGISHMLFGGSNEAAAPAQSAPVQQQQYQSGGNCEAHAKGIVPSRLCIKMILIFS